MNLPNFWYGTSLNFDSFRGTNHTVSCYYYFLLLALRLAAAIFGLSASAAEAYGFTLFRSSVRPPFVRHTPYLENRASDFDDFLHKARS